MKKGISWKTTMFEMLCSNCRVKRRWGRVQARTATTSWAKATTPTAPITIVPLHPAVASTTATIQGTPQPRQRSTVATATAINNTQNININVQDMGLFPRSDRNWPLQAYQDLYFSQANMYVNALQQQSLGMYHGYCGQSHRQHSLGRAMQIYWHRSQPPCWSGNHDQHYRR